MTSYQSYEFSLANLPGSPPETPLSHLTTTNNPPTDKEIGIIHAITDADKIAIDKIDKMLDDLSNIEGILKSRRSEYTQRGDLHKQILNPHRSLPTDLLCEIFQHFLYEMYANLGSCLLPHRILAEVCHRWRDTLFRNPRLWMILPAFDLRSLHMREKPFNSMLRTALQLSRAAPLNIKIRLVELSEFTPHPALASLLLSSDRYQRLSLAVLDRFLPNFTSIRGKLSGLRSLDLHIHKGRQTVDFPSTLKLFDDTPNLQDLTFKSNVSFPMPLCESVLLPWSQLIRFSGHCIKPIDIVTVLTHATSLEDCTFHCAFLPMAFSSLPSIVHRKLLKLRIYSQERKNRDSEPFPVDILDQLTLPSLIEITIKDIGLQTRTIVNLVTRSQCVLSFVDLETCIYGDIYSLLDAISAVRTLCITPTLHLVKFLFHPQNFQPFLPRLRHLMFYSMVDIPAQETAWISLARATQSVVDPLSTFIIATVRLSRSHYEALYDKLDQWPGMNTWETRFPVLKRWIKLTEDTSFGKNRQDEMEKMILAKNLSKIETLREIHPRYLYESTILSSTTRLRQLVETQDDFYCLQSRLSSLIARWVSTLDNYLNCFGWMHPPDLDCPTEIVYGKREGSLLISTAVMQSRSVFQK